MISYAISQAAAINQISENVSESISEEDSEAVSLLYSDNISAENTLSFHLTLEDEGSYVLTFTPCWGTPVISETDDSMILIENGDPVSMKADGSVKVADSEAGSGEDTGNTEGTDI